MRGDQPMAWRVQRHTVAAHGAVTDFCEDEVITPDGHTMTRQYLKHPGAVAVLAWDQDADAILVLRQYRHPVRMNLVEIPAGLLDVDGEDWLPAAQRELAEEAELAAATWRVMVDIFTSPGASEESLRIYLATDLSPAARPQGFDLRDEEAHMSREWVPREELVDAVLAGQCQSPPLVSGVMALHAVILQDRLSHLRPGDAPWPARTNPC